MSANVFLRAKNDVVCHICRSGGATRRLRWWIAAFALVCATRPRGIDAVQVVQRPLDAPADAPRFANGKDVFGRDARCRTCHALLNTLNPRLVPALLKIKAKEARRASGGARTRAR